MEANSYLTRIFNSYLTRIFRIALFVPAVAMAQGGPPLVTDDPDTPGAGKWEVNYAVTGQRTRERREIAAPDIDMNYGLGERIQLKLDLPWMFVRDDGESWKSGLGRGDAGVKWRFIDRGEDGVAVSTYPQFSWNILPSSVRRGITESGNEFLLPIEVSKKVGDVGLDFEVGRNFVQRGDNEWVAGAIVAPKCGEKSECLLEVHETWSRDTHQTLVNVGLRQKLGESMSLLAAVGREFGPSTDDQRRLVFYIGVQVRR